MNQETLSELKILLDAHREHVKRNARINHDAYLEKISQYPTIALIAYAMHRSAFSNSCMEHGITITVNVETQDGYANMAIFPEHLPMLVGMFSDNTIVTLSLVTEIDENRNTYGSVIISKISILQLAQILNNTGSEELSLESEFTQRKRNLGLE